MRGNIHLFNRHRTKWTVVVDRPRVVATLTLFDTQAAADAEIVRLRQDGGDFLPFSKHFFGFPMRG
jgi:hypothetical protein